MSRRIINQNDSDSLKDEKQKAEALRAQANSAEKRVKEAGDSLTSIQSDINHAEDVLGQLGDAKAIKIAEIAKFESEVEAAKAELQQVGGELSAAISGLEKIKADTQKAQSEHTHTLSVLASDHKNQVAAYEKTQSSMRSTIKELEEKLELRKGDLASTEKVQNVYLREIERIEKEVLPQIPKRKEELELIERELLVKQVEVKNTEDKLATLKGEANLVKAELDEAIALKLAEENIIAENMQKLIEKEGEVDRKMNGLRVLQTGVDQATARLKRREEEVELKLHLSAPEKEVIHK